ncbi:amino acid permease/ SLC12A domain-containing protein [Rhodocollybia butyracea]|uniref:Amino acid permease/ SLC12A domain-containing protein n=1 Tax=Rhodocollybia butyracea TaxID=206335 RepID=A0A9P5Q1X8_9AGAR|nr:amino acid permease/ SLC12A domain-containing protein [Rhodocollybia butyracea]
MSALDEKDKKTYISGWSNDVEPIVSDAPAEDEQVFAEERELKRGLQQRHIQMIALAGTIGTVRHISLGLFLGSGEALASAGPVGALLGYILTGFLVSGVVLSIAELAALVPLTGSYVRHAEYFFDPALSFAIGWNTVYASCMSIPAEITAATVLISFWPNSVSNGVWITVMGLLIIVSNIFFLSSHVTGLCIDLGGVSGQHRLGFQYWRNPGPFVQYLNIPGSLGQFLGFWTTFSNAAYAYSGIEAITIAAAETKNPRTNIPKAAKRIFFRVLLFYVVSILIVTMIVPSNSELLLNGSGNATQSPFVIVVNLAGVKVVPHIVNAIVLSSAWSAGNATMLGGSRILYGLAREGHAPKFFLRTNRFGIPYICVSFLSVFMALGYMTLQSSASIVFGWFQELVAAAALIIWIVICIVYLRFYYACKHQGIDRSELPWAAPFQPFAAWIALLGFSLILLTGGFRVFIHGSWDTETFFGSYFNIPLILILYFGYKFTKKTRIVGLGASTKGLAKD